MSGIWDLFCREEVTRHSDSSRLLLFSRMAPAQQIQIHLCELLYDSPQIVVGFDQPFHILHFLDSDIASLGAPTERDCQLARRVPRAAACASAALAPALVGLLVYHAPHEVRNAMELFQKIVTSFFET